ncbi:MAG: hypothetical protein ACD_48C00580G0001 [uncultured bacterium]|nr:MAG: hypothetical protein ACD_48C00580G0001 [uncultured bacterium]
MSELYAPHEGGKTCPVCKIDAPSHSNDLIYTDPRNQETFYFDSEECYKQFTENPEQFSEAKQEDVEE